MDLRSTMNCADYLVVAHYGHEIYFSKGTAMNIKVTYPEDIVLFESILRISGDM